MLRGHCSSPSAEICTMWLFGSHWNEHMYVHSLHSLKCDLKCVFWEIPEYIHMYVCTYMVYIRARLLFGQIWYVRRQMYVRSAYVRTYRICLNRSWARICVYPSCLYQCVIKSCATESMLLRWCAIECVCYIIRLGQCVLLRLCHYVRFINFYIYLHRPWSPNHCCLYIVVS